MRVYLAVAVDGYAFNCSPVCTLQDAFEMRRNCPWQAFDGCTLIIIAEDYLELPEIRGMHSTIHCSIVNKLILGIQISVSVRKAPVRAPGDMQERKLNSTTVGSWQRKQDYFYVA
ncbi:hypothetical protein Zmor_004591 [Zophobas morio]|uniref:Uncharacterized protein n=1 Tax=Zophobas morio TaxID=2755281 RepID=A0AA38IRP9_9CUCU|nr:hypothetical protein Zmor_004591 [Zophobas morio]